MLLGTIEKENKTLVIHFRKEKEKKKRRRGIHNSDGIGLKGEETLVCE